MNNHVFSGCRFFSQDTIPAVSTGGKYKVLQQYGYQNIRLRLFFLSISSPALFLYSKF
jgi:hypothetical protein